MTLRRNAPWTALLCLVALVAMTGCAMLNQETTTSRDKTKKGAAIGAASGAAGALLLGERELDEILVGAAIGAGVGAGVGAYMDHQEEKLARIPGTTVERVGDKTLLVHFDSDVLFAVGSAQLNTEARSALDQAAEVFLEYRKTAILAQGHTDSSGSEEFNQELSERRAKSVMNYLVGRGVEGDRITALGYGEGHPVADNGTPDGRSRNRRVDLLLKAKAT
jgi:outer membrane protein OmpA-like peptidoglycan-associated protein